jgi:type II secretory pathway pseudopilin PulG
MKQLEGYTTAEALAALAILGLAMAGLTTSMGLIRASQAKARDRVEQTILQRTAGQRLERLLSYDPPFSSDQNDHFIGDARGFELDCRAGRRCSARFDKDVLITVTGDGREARSRLPQGAAPRFVYLADGGTSDIWPPSPKPPPAPALQALSGVMIRGDGPNGEKPLALAKVWRQQRADCEYDLVLQDCRGAGS